MDRHSILFLVTLLLGCACRRDSPPQPLDVTYIANEGFLIAMGETTILIDALSQSEYYASPSDSLLARMMDGIPPFDRIASVLVTHGHADHFNAGLTSRFLLKHPSVQFVANKETSRRLSGEGNAARQGSGVDLERGKQRTIQDEKAEITMLRLDHGSSRDINNLAFLVRANGYTIFHVGDARLCDNEEFLRSIDWEEFDVDILFIEFFDRGSDTQSIIQNLIKPRHVILMHIPPGEEDNVRNSDEKVHPGSVVFTREYERRRFE